MSAARSPVGVASIATLALLQACSTPRALSPVVTSPLQTSWESPASSSSAVTFSYSASAPEAARAAWWQVFQDPTLDQLMRLGLEQNLDLKLAQARIAQARAQQRAAAAQLLPSITASAEDEYTHNPTVPAGFPQTTLLGALNASWTVDLFGQLRNAKRAADASTRASEFDRDNSVVALLSEIATNYLQYRLYQLEYVISQRNAASQEQTVRITQLRFDQGAASRLEVEQLVSQLAITRAALPQALEQADTARQTLILLLASTPERLAKELPASVPDNPQLPMADAQVVLRTPLQVIAERPDVRAAEQRLRSAGATLRSTEAERYPQLSLSALVGQEATNWSAIGRGSSRAWSYGELLTMPIFEFGRIQAAIDQADAQQRQAYLSYEQTVRSALESTQSAIVLYTQGWARSQQLEQALKSAHIAATLARRQYQDGALALLNVLDTERTEYSTELSWAEAAATASIRLVTLYQAMGALPPKALPPVADDTKYWPNFADSRLR